MTTYQAAVAVGLFALIATLAAFTFTHKTHGRKMKSFFPGVVYSLGILLLPAIIAAVIVSVFWAGSPMLAIVFAGMGYYGALFVSARLLDKALVDQASLGEHSS